MDGGPRLERQCRLGCRRKQSNFRLSGQTRDARSAQAAYHRAMGFPEGLRPRSRRWTLLLSQELRSAAPQRQSVLYVQANLQAEPSVVLDPNTLSPDGSLSLSDWKASRDGKLVVYGVSEGGADWETLTRRPRRT